MKIYFTKFWLPIAISSTIILATIFAVAQQNLRMSANDPQIAMAEDGAMALEQGSLPQILVGSSHIDMARSLAVFQIIYSEAGTTTASTGFLDNKVPLLPAGVLDFARTNIDDRITWQPASSTRIAAVVKHFGGKNPGYIVVGRNLREVEIRESQLEFMVIVAWIGIMILTIIAVIFAYFAEKRHYENSHNEL